MNTTARLLRLLGEQLPTLSDAACAGPNAGLWDSWADGSTAACETAPERALRHRQATRICLTACPALERCRRMRDTHPALARDDGIWAGRLYEGRTVTPIQISRSRLQEAI